MLFRGHPLFFGLSCELPNPGDYRADDLSGVPILVVRGQRRHLKAFLNVCRHRGAKVASGSGSGKRLFVCPYHAFTYDLDGRLTRLKPEAGFPGLTCAERSLVPLPVAEKHGLILVQATPGAAIDVDALLGRTSAPEFASYGFDSYSHYKTQTLAKDMNWKLVIDTFLETWHVATLHTETVGADLPAQRQRVRRLRPQRPAHHSAPVAAGAEEPSPRAAGISSPTAPSSTRCFPTRCWCGRATISRPGARSRSATTRTDASQKRHCSRPSPPSPTRQKRHWDRNLDLLMRTVDAEDFPVCLDIQRGFGAGAQTHITFGRNEPALGHYHRSLSQAVDLGTSDQS